MITTGIVAEYNPFHNGHKYHIEKTREKTNCENIVVVMSGNFVQRGEPAVMDKWERTKAALLNGADMVLELPVLFSTATAEIFAQSAVKLLNDSGIVDFISFASECGDIKDIELASSLISNESHDFKKYIKAELDKGASYPSARQIALEKATGVDQGLISFANNILATEYLKSLKKINSSITPITIMRKGEGYNSINTQSHYASATAIRHSVSKGEVDSIKLSMPESSFDILKKNVALGKSPVTLDSFSHALNFCLRSLSKAEIAKILDISEGLENRIVGSLCNSYTTTEILNTVKTKRYTYTRLQRALLHILLSIKTSDMDYFKANGFCPYIRVLGFKKEKQFLVSSLTKNSKLPIITNFKSSDEFIDENCRFLLELEKKATDIYFLGCPNNANKILNKEYTTPVVII